MEYVILGFLLIRNLTQYDIKAALEKKVSPFFSASLGSIQAALKKLENNVHVEVYETVENGRKKKIYSITGTGKTHFMTWMLSYVLPNKTEHEVTTRLFFLGLMQPSERLNICKSIICELENKVKEFKEGRSESAQMRVPEQLVDIVKFQLKTLDLGLYYYTQILEWFRNFYLELEGENHD